MFSRLRVIGLKLPALSPEISMTSPALQNYQGWVYAHHIRTQPSRSGATNVPLLTFRVRVLNPGLAGLPMLNHPCWHGPESQLLGYGQAMVTIHHGIGIVNLVQPDGVIAVESIVHPAIAMFVVETTLLVQS